MRIHYTVIFFLNKRFEKQGKQKIYGRIFYKRKKSEFATNLWIEPNKWNHQLQSAIKSPFIMKKLNSIRVEIDEIVDRLKYEGKHIDHKSIKDHYVGKNVFDIGIIAFIRKLKEVKAKQKNLSKETPIKYEQLAIKVEKYICDTFRVTDIDIKRVDLKFIRGFNNYLLSIESKQYKRPLSQTTINKTHGFFKTVLNEARFEGYINEQPYTRFRLKKAAAKIKYLTKEELIKIENLDLTSQPSLDKARDLFVFSVYTGLRYGDALALKISDLLTINYQLFIRLESQQKTSNSVENPLFPQAQKIIDKYKNSGERQIKGKLLPHLNNSKLNEHLKTIGKIAGIQQHIHHHMARHTCATTILLENNVSIEMVKEFLGHQSITSTMVYAKITNTNKIKTMDMVNRLMNAS